MKININIMIDDDVYLNEHIVQMRRTKKLSQHINGLLRASFNISKETRTKDEEALDKELLESKIKIVALEEAKAKIEAEKATALEEAKQEESRWKQIY